MEERTVEATIDRMEALTSFAEEMLDSYGVPMKIQTQMAVVIDEIFTNIVSYAYPNETGKAKLGIDMDGETGTLKLVFTDSGIPYDPLAHEDPDVTLSAEERQIGGLGIFMVKKMMDKISYSRENGQNILTLEKIINA